MTRRQLLSLAGCCAPSRVLASEPADIVLRIAEVAIDLVPRPSVKTLAYNGEVPGPVLRAAEGKSIASVRATTSFQAVHGVDVVGVWTNNDNDQGGEAVKKPTSWQSIVKRAALANGSSASSAECR